jgi:bacillithiol system protein YtxJ
MHHGIEEIRDHGRLEEILGGATGLIFKHSTRCWQSSAALDQVTALLDDGLEMPVWLIDVIRQRPLAAVVADRLDIRHESPQAILLVEGDAVWHASHSAIKTAVVGGAVAEAGSGAA